MMTPAREKGKPNYYHVAKNQYDDQEKIIYSRKTRLNGRGEASVHSRQKEAGKKQERLGSRKKRGMKRVKKDMR
jgi:hypothetical protein